MFDGVLSMPLPAGIYLLKLTTEILEQGVKYVFKVNNKWPQNDVMKELRAICRSTIPQKQFIINIIFWDLSHE